MEAAHERLADVAVFAMTLDLRDIEHILFHVALYYAVCYVQLNVAAVRKRNVRKRVHHKCFDLLRALRCMNFEAVRSDGILEVHGVQNARLMHGSFVMHQQLATVRDATAARKGGQHLEVLRTGCNIDVCAASGCQSADLTLQVECFRAVDGDHLNGFHEVQTHAKRSTERIVQMSARLEVNGVQVVGDNADHRGIEVVLHDSLQQCRHVARGGAFAHHQMTAVAQPLKYVLFAERLVIGGHTRCNTCAHCRAVYIRQMTLQCFPRHGKRVVKRLQKIGEACGDVGTDALGQAYCIRPAQRLADNLRVEAPAACLQIRRERNVGRYDKVYFQICCFRFFQDGLNALQTGHNTNLVQVCHNASCAVRKHRFRKGTDRQ